MFIGVSAFLFGGAYYWIRKKLLESDGDDYESEGGQTTRIRHEANL